MAKTLANLVTGIRVYLDEASVADYTAAEVLRSANYGYHDVVREVIEVYEEFYSTTTPYTYAIVANQQEYTIASSLIKVTRVEINYKPTDSNSRAMRALPVKKDEILTNLAHSNSSGSLFNAGYYLHGNIGAQKIGFIPIPTIADTSGQSISVWGIDLPSDLSADSDNVNIPYADNFAQLIELKAASILLSKGQQAESSSTKYIGLYKQGTPEMKQFLSERQSDSVRMIADSEGDNIDFGSF